MHDILLKQLYNTSVLLVHQSYRSAVHTHTLNQLNAYTRTTVTTVNSCSDARISKADSGLTVLVSLRVKLAFQAHT